MRLDRPVLVSAVVAYLLAPGHPFSLFTGVPLSVQSLIAAIGITGWCIAFPGRPPRALTFLAGVLALLVLKLVLWWAAPPYGLLAEYRAGSPASSVERSTEWPALLGTRVDLSLGFRGSDVPIHFFNDVQRFNYFTANEPRRDGLPFSASWTGYVWAPTDGEYEIAMEANGQATANLGSAHVSVESGERVRDASSRTALVAGLHPIEVRYARPPEVMPWMVVSIAPPGEAAHVLASPNLLRNQVEPTWLQRDRLLAVFARWVDLAYVVLLTVLVALHAATIWRSSRRPTRAAELLADPRVDRAVLGLFTVTTLLVELWAQRYLVGQTILLSGGNDWLAYESFARRVLTEGPLLSEGKPFGQATAFYYQPLYIYWLAFVHWLLGEGVFAALFGNVVLGVATGLLVFVLARDLFGRLAAYASLAIFSLLGAWVFAPTTGLLLSENLLFPLIPLLMLFLARAARTGSWRYLIAAGVVLGLAALARTTPLALLPLAMAVLAIAYRRLAIGWWAAAGRLAALVLVCFATISPATARNLVVSGRPVLITSSGGANLWETHRPSGRVDLSRVDRDPLYNALRLDRYAREVAEYARQDPTGYAASLAPMALFAVGVVGAPYGTSEIHPGLFGICLAYLLVTIAIPRARSLPTWFLHAFILSHLAQMTVFLSNQYGFRLILPMYVAMTPIVGCGMAAIIHAVVRWTARRFEFAAGGSTSGIPAATRAAFPLVVVGVASLGLTAALPVDDAAREAFYGLSGDAAIAARFASRSDSLRLADEAYFVGDDSRSSEVAYLRGLAYPWLRWFDGARGFVRPPIGQRGLYILPDRAAADFTARCLDEQPEVAREIDLPTRQWFVAATAEASGGSCPAIQHPLEVAFEGVAKLTGYDAPASIEPGSRLDVVLHWEALGRPANRARPWVRLVDGRGRRWGQAESAVYPSSSWRAGELAIGMAQIDLDPTLPPGAYRLELGFTSGSGLAGLAEDSTWGTRGQTHLRVGQVRLVSRSTPPEPDALPITVPLGDRFGDLTLLGATLDREMPRPGERLRLGLFWQNTGHRLPDHDVVIAIRDRSGRVLETWRRSPVDGIYPTSAWKPGEIVRDTHDFVLPSALPPGGADLAVGVATLGDQVQRWASVATLAIQPIQRKFEPPRVRTGQEADLADGVRLIGYELKNRRLRPGDTLEFSLYWQALRDGQDGLTILTEIVGPDARVVARQEVEPAAGRRPTAGWAGGEFIEDAHRLRLPRETPRGRYQIVIALMPLDDSGVATARDLGRVTLSSEVVVE